MTKHINLTKIREHFYRKGLFKLSRQPDAETLILVDSRYDIVIIPKTRIGRQVCYFVAKLETKGPRLGPAGDTCLG